MGADRGAEAKHRTVDDRLTVNRMGNGFAHFHVIQWRHLVVGRQDGFTFGVANQNLETWISFELWQCLRRWETGKHINVFGHHRRHSCGWVGDELEGHIGQRRRRAPIRIVACERDLVALHPVVKLEGTGADGRGFDVCDALRRNDDCVAPRHVEQEVTIGAIECDFYGHRIDYSDVSDTFEEGFLCVGAVLGAGAVQREFHVFAVHGRPVMEGHTVVQHKGVGQPVFRDLPAFGEAWRDSPVRGKAGEALKNVGI